MIPQLPLGGFQAQGQMDNVEFDKMFPILWSRIIFRPKLNPFHDPPSLKEKNDMALAF